MEFVDPIYRVKSLFLSDIHLGAIENNAATALEIIEKYHFDNLFLVGDIIDIKELRRKWRWGSLDSSIIHRIIKIANKKNVIYITGNHERGFFDDLPESGLPVKFYRELVYNNMLIAHGDQFDVIIGNRQWLYNIGDIGYNWSIWLTHKINQTRRLVGLKGECKLSKDLKKLVKKSINYLSNYHAAATTYAKYKSCHTVICGHTHQQEFRKVDGVRYFNIGNMRQDKQYLIEELDGSLILKDVEKDK